MLKCALPVTVPAQTNPFEAYHAAVDACLTTAADRVLFEVCDPTAGSPLVPDANGQLSYLVASSKLIMGEMTEVRTKIHTRNTRWPWLKRRPHLLTTRVTPCTVLPLGGVQRDGQGRRGREDPQGVRRHVRADLSAS